MAAVSLLHEALRTSDLPRLFSALCEAFEREALEDRQEAASLRSACTRRDGYSLRLVRQARRRGHDALCRAAKAAQAALCASGSPAGAGAVLTGPRRDLMVAALAHARSLPALVGQAGLSCGAGEDARRMLLAELSEVLARPASMRDVEERKRQLRGRQAAR